MKNDLPDLTALMTTEDGLTHPRWDVIEQSIESVFPENKKHLAWVAAERQWLDKLSANLGGCYQCVESQHFLVLTESSARLAKAACKFFEQSLKLILKYLPGVARDEGYGKQIVLMFTDEDDYYRYVMHFHDDGTHPMSGGMCISSGGCLHYAIPVNPDDPSGYRTTLVHELTHGCVSHLPLPTWLNEALAMRMEQVVCGTQTMLLDRFLLKEHFDYWNAKTIQQFWSGESWGLADEGFQLSYNLAEIIWNKIENEMRAPQELILNFILLAHYENAGEMACREVFDLSLGDFVEDFIGEGYWTPKSLGY
ncbi:MAG: hypothetical protein AB8F34_00505 [Akkermansiaceae bacterium]